MSGLLLGVLGASLLGSPHCAGMCGPFAIIGGASAAARGLYHATRIAAYVGLGAVAGTLGAGLDLGGAAFGVQRAALVLAAVTLLAAGAWMLLRPHWGPRVRLPTPRWARDLVARVTRSAAGRSPTVRATLLGGASALLPCGWLYAFVAAAAGTGSATGGALVMLAFGVGTVPLLLLVSIGARRLSEPLRRRAPTAVGLVLLLLGTAALAGRFEVPALATGAPAAAIDDVEARVRAIDPSELPCCGGGDARVADD